MKGVKDYYDCYHCIYCIAGYVCETCHPCNICSRIKNGKTDQFFSEADAAEYLNKMDDKD